MKFKVTFKLGVQTLAEVVGVREVGKEELTVAEAEKVLDMERLLEKITGFRVHIQQV
jgi:hypothetical protein